MVFFNFLGAQDRPEGGWSGYKTLTGVILISSFQCFFLVTNPILAQDLCGNEGPQKLLTNGVWNASTTISVPGGQGMRFILKNTNALGTTITISGRGQTHSTIIPPLGSVSLEFSEFGEEPMTWDFTITTDSDAFVVSWYLCSTWVPGDPPNPPPNP